MLNVDSPIPLYHQLSDILMDKIRKAEYPVDFRIPSEHQLAAEYGIGRPTARQATDLLVRKGVLVRKRGSGTFVCRQRREVDVLSLAGTISSFQKQGLSFSTRILCPMHLMPVAGPDHNPFLGTEAFFYQRITEVENEPVLLEDIYLSAALFPRIDQIDLKDRSLSQVVQEHYYLRPSGGKQDFRIMTLSKEKAAVMKTSTDSPILLVNRYIHFPQKKDGIYSDLYCRTDQVVFSQTLGDMKHE